MTRGAPAVDVVAVAASPLDQERAVAEYVEAVLRVLQTPPPPSSETRDPCRPQLLR